MTTVLRSRASERRAIIEEGERWTVIATSNEFRRIRLMQELTGMRGIIHGKTIELDREPGLQEGQEVMVSVQPLAAPPTSGVGIERAFGGWDENVVELDEYLEWNRRQRKATRSETPK